MKNKAYDLSLYTFSTDEQIIVDANIWLYLFPPPGNPQASFAKSYSKYFARMRRAGAKPVLDPMVMSEYLNRYCRIEWQGRYNTIYSDFKNSDSQQISRSWLLPPLHLQKKFFL